ncbi:MAG: hypothetical protein E7Z92_07215 [Cyanobacteria bacterium SIG31]|nr:hypothetical protein [Cyanobacteria bacterium SIG31]
MGMAASQARYLSLIAQQSNLEYQGQQINQERTVLSQQVTDLYNTLLDMKVPTPPLTSEYTTVVYTGNDGASNFTIGSVKPSGESYNVEIKKTLSGAGLQQEYGKAVVSKGAETINVAPVETTVKTDNYKNMGQDNVAIGDDVMVLSTRLAANSPLGEDAYILEGTTFVLHKAGETFDTVKDIYKREKCTDANKENAYAIEEETTPKSVKNITNYYVVENGTLRHAVASDFEENDGTYTFKSGVSYMERSASGQSMANPDAGKVTVSDKPTMTWTEFENHPGYDAKYRQAITNTYGEEGDIQPEDFLVYQDSDGTFKFSLYTDVHGQDSFAEVYSFGMGTYTATEWKDGCNLTFDASGRITAIDIPIFENGGLVRYQTLPLEAATETDTKAYDDAMAKYEYEQYLYDKEQKEINARTEVIQQQDRNLELKLQRLDNNRKQITTEIEALEKVIDENIEKSYKTFSG